MKKGENSLRMMQFHLAGFIFFQNTSQKTRNHSVSQLHRSLWKVSPWQARGAGSVRGAGAAPAAPHSWACPEPWRAPGGPDLAHVPLTMYPMPGVGTPPAPLLRPHGACLRRKGGVSGRELFWSRQRSCCCQPLHSREQSHGGGTVKKQSPVTCCVTLHPHLPVLLPSSCITGAGSASSVGAGALQPLTRLLRMGPSPAWLRLCGDKCGTDASNTVCLYSVSSWHSAF